MKGYKVSNRITHECISVTGVNSAQEACEHLGWQIGDCYVQEFEPPQVPGQASPLTEEERDTLQDFLQADLADLSTGQIALARCVVQKWFDAQDWTE